MTNPFQPQRYEATFTMPDGTTSDPVIVIQGQNESLAAWKARCISAFEAAWNAAHQ